MLCRLFAGVLAMAICQAHAGASLVSWDIDATKSKITLQMPDTLLDVDGTNRTVRVRNQPSSGNAWNIGNTAFLDGFLNTNYREGSVPAIEFQPNPLGQIVGLNSGTYRGIPMPYNSPNTHTDDPEQVLTAPATFGGRVLAQITFPFNVGYFSISNVSYDARSADLPLTGDIATTQTFAAQSVDFGLAGGVLNLDGVALLVSLAWDLHQLQLLWDLGDIELPREVSPNTAAGNGTIENLGGLARKMTVPIRVPLLLDLGEVVLPIQLTGTIVANAVVPEPSALAMAAVGLLGLAVLACQHKRTQRV